MRKLNVLNYFDPTSLSPNVVPVDEDEIDLDITLAEKSSDKASANIGFTGIYGMTGVVTLNSIILWGGVKSYHLDLMWVHKYLFITIMVSLGNMKV